MITKIMIKSFLVNLTLTVIKLLGSFFSNSKTLLADSIHCLSDMSTDIIGLIGSKLSNKRPDNEHPFGHGKIEYLTSILISFFIISLGIGIISNTFKGNLKQTSGSALIVIIISIIIKFILSSYLLKKGKELNSNILTTNGTESRYDTYSSLIALIFILISFLGGKHKIFLYADIIGSLVMSIFTLKIGIEILKKNLSSVLGEVEENSEKTDKIKELVLKNKKVLKIRRISLLKYGPYYAATIEIIMDSSLSLEEVYNVEKKIKKELKNLSLNIRYVTVNIKPKSHVKK